MRPKTLRRSLRALALLLAVTAGSISCGASPESAAASGSNGLPAHDEPAKAAPPPASASLPPGHPPLGSAAPAPPAAPHAGMVPAVPKGSGTGAAGLSWEVPSTWVSQTPSSSMRRAQYQVKGPGGDAECVVFYFGPGQGGTPMANAERWASQFVGPDGQPATAALKTRNIEVRGIPVLLVEVRGQYSGGMAPAGQAPRPITDAALLGAIAEGPDANWFFKFTGPASTVEEERGEFDALIQSLRAGT